MNTSINLSELSSKSITHINCSLSSNQEMKFEVEDGQNQTEEQPEKYSVSVINEIDQNYNQSEKECVILLAKLLKAFAKSLEEKKGEQPEKYYEINEIDQNHNQAEEEKNQQDYHEEHNIVSSEEFKANAKALEENLSEKAEYSLDLGNPFEELLYDSFLDLNEFNEL